MVTNSNAEESIGTEHKHAEGHGGFQRWVVKMSRIFMLWW